jgi:hypothetical protein
MKRFLFIVCFVFSSQAQEKKFPLSINDNMMIYNILGSSKVLMSVSTILERLDNTYGTNRHTIKVKDGLKLLAIESRIDTLQQNITGIKVLTNQSGVVKVFVKVSTGEELSITALEISQRKAIAYSPDFTD